MARPSAGKAALRTVACCRTRRTFVDSLRRATHMPTTSGTQPRSPPMREASRRLRSAVAISSPMSTSSVLSSIRSNARRTAVPCDEVDHAPFTVDRERDLGAKEPSRESVEPTGHLFGHGGVLPVEQPVEVSAPPARLEVEPDVQRRTDRERSAQSGSGSPDRAPPPIRRSESPGPRPRDRPGASASVIRTERMTDPRRISSTQGSLVGRGSPRLTAAGRAPRAGRPSGRRGARSGGPPRPRTSSGPGRAVRRSRASRVRPGSRPSRGR